MRHVFALAVTALLVAGVPGSRAQEGPAPEQDAEELGQGADAETLKRAAMALRSLPYASSVPIAGEDLPEGVIRHDTGRAFAGLNVYAEQKSARAALLDMTGRVVHSWRSDGLAGERWHHVEVLDDGDLVVIEKDVLVARISVDSETRWSLAGRFHHDVAVADNGDFLVPNRGERLWAADGRDVPILADWIEVVGPGGESRRRIQILEGASRYLPAERGRKVLEAAREGRLLEAYRAGKRGIVKSGSPGDFFHLNSIEILPRDVPGLGRRGHLLISLRHLDLVAVVDPESGEFGWVWGPGEVEAQHHPSLLDNGHVLLFDNGPWRGYSRVVEVAPASGEIVWEYRGDPPSSFLSPSRGACQRLPNGNTLITESDAGYMFEVTPEREVVWELYTRVRGRQRATVYRLARLVDPPRWR